MGGYWWMVLSKAFWDSFALFYEKPVLLLIAVLGFIVTALLVLVFRGRDAFVEHIKANVLIAAGGGFLTWLLVFPYFIVRAPFQSFSDVQSELALQLERERHAVYARLTAEQQLEVERKVCGHSPSVPPTPKPVSTGGAYVLPIDLPNDKRNILVDDLKAAPQGTKVGIVIADNKDSESADSGELLAKLFIRADWKPYVNQSGTSSFVVSGSTGATSITEPLACRAINQKSKEFLILKDALHDAGLHCTSGPAFGIFSRQGVTLEIIIQPKPK